MNLPMYWKPLIRFILPLLLFITVSGIPPAMGQASPKAPVSRVAWGEWEGKQVYLYTLRNKAGTEIKISNYGGTLTSWTIKDKAGKRANIVLGFDHLAGYLAHPPYFGATIGRYGNRIAKARFTIGNQEYNLAANNGKNHLHGGVRGFDKVVWTPSTNPGKGAFLRLEYLSRDGEEGYPGNLRVTVTFLLDDANQLTITYQGLTDQTTPVNLTNHSYFNLTGDVTQTILENILQVNAEKYTPVDSALIPTGELAGVRGTAFDFLEPHRIGERIALVPGGYDHNFVLIQGKSPLHPAATLKDPRSGRVLRISTTEPGLQFYSGNFLDGTQVTDAGQKIEIHTGLCLETQHFPDSPNKPAFPNSLLRPGERYYSKTVYSLSMETNRP
jgi:aldose 1-epimerase